ncbi:hypothetical protein BsWGS_11714 [Bradybaena similaris]
MDKRIQTQSNVLKAGKNSQRSSHLISTRRSHSDTSRHQHNKNPNILRLPRWNSWDKLSYPQDNIMWGQETLQVWNLILSQLYGLLVKKMLYSIRNYRVTCLQTIVPLCIMWIGLSLLRKDTHGFRKVSLTSTLLRDASVVSAVVGPEDIAASRLEKLYRDTVRLSGGKSLSLLSMQFAGLQSEGIVKKNVPTEQDILIGAIFTTVDSHNLSTTVNITALYNFHADYSEDVSVATVIKAVHSYCINLQYINSTDKQRVNFAVQPLPLATNEAEQHLYMISRRFCIQLSATVLLSMTFLTATFAIFMAKERQTGSRHLQLLSGADPLMYYVSTAVVDMLVYILVSDVIFTSLAFLNSMSLVYQKHGIALIFVTTSYGLTSLPLVYSLQFLFRRPTLCMLFVFSFRITLGACLLILSSEDRGLLGVDSSWLVGQDLLSLNMLSPSYSLFVALYGICMDFESREDCLNHKVTCANNSLHQCCLDSRTVRMVFELILPWICWSALFIMLDANIPYILRRYLSALKKHLVNNVRNRDGIDIQQENKDVSNNSFKDVIALKNIVKRFGKKIVINNLSVAVSKGECLCFLGTEKSGKSTLLNIVTGHTFPSGGTMLIYSQDILLSTVKAKTGMSYSPQEIVLMDELTGRDILLLHGRLRGVPRFVLNVAIQTLINELRILKPDKTCKEYSSADAKKLSIALSLIGKSQTVVLDEPTLGLDYTDKKTVWRLLSSIQKEHRTVIVATSSGEECEIVCGKKWKMAILNEGKLECLTSPQELIKDYGTGYTVIVQFRTDEGGSTYSHMPFLNSAVEAFTDVEIISDGDVCRMHFPKIDLNLGKVFAVLEDGVRYYNVADYSVQKTSLAHILYSLSVHSEEEYIEIPPGVSSSFDVWPPQVSFQQSLETYVH